MHLVRIVILVGHGTKYAKKAKIWAKMTKNDKFGRFGAKGSKSFGTHISENHKGTSFALFVWLGMGQKCQNLP